MRGERGFTTGETVAALALAMVLFIAGLGIGGAFDSDDSSSDSEGATSGLSVTTAPAPPSSGEPTADELAALSRATAERTGAEAERQGAEEGASAAAEVVGEAARERRQAAQRAAYWAAVGTTMASLHGLGARIEQLKTARQVKRERVLLRRLQAHTLFTLGRLRQMRSDRQRRKLATLLAAAADRALTESLTAAEQVLNAASTQAANAAANELSRLGARLNRSLTELERYYVEAIEAAEDGNDDAARQYLDEMEAVAADL